MDTADARRELINPILAANPPIPNTQMPHECPGWGPVMGFFLWAGAEFISYDLPPALEICVNVGDFVNEVVWSVAVEFSTWI
jgi:hypothetical protein